MEKGIKKEIIRVRSRTISGVKKIFEISIPQK
jgi:hypothetical protein